MPKSSTHGILAFEEARETQKRKFLDKLQTLGFQEFTTEEKLKEATENPKLKPKRATFDNVIQKQYYLILKNGDQIHIHTSMIGDDFASTGTAWGVGKDKKTGKKISLICPRNHAASVLFRLGACAELLKQIFENRIPDTILVEPLHDVFCWRSSGNDTVIDFSRYAKYLPKKESKYLLDRFKRSAKWIKDNPHRKRRRKIRKTWEDAKK